MEPEQEEARDNISNKKEHFSIFRVCLVVVLVITDLIVAFIALMLSCGGELTLCNSKIYWPVFFGLLILEVIIWWIISAVKKKNL